MEPTNTYPNGQPVQPPAPSPQPQPPVVVQPAGVSAAPPVVTPAAEPVAPVVPTQVVQQPVEVAPAPQPSMMDTNEVYPAALNQEQRIEQREEVRAHAQTLLQRPLSQFLVLLAVSVFSVRMLFDEIKSLFGIGAPDTMSMFGAGTGFVWQERIVSIVTIALIIAAIYAAYRVFRGSKLALAFLTGAFVMYVFAALPLYVGYILRIYQIGAFESVADFWFVLTTGILMLGGIVFAWVRERQFYS